MKKLKKFPKKIKLTDAKKHIKKRLTKFNNEEISRQTNKEDEEDIKIALERLKDPRRVTFSMEEVSDIFDGPDPENFETYKVYVKGLDSSSTPNIIFDATDDEMKQLDLLKGNWGTIDDTVRSASRGNLTEQDIKDFETVRGLIRKEGKELGITRGHKDTKGKLPLNLVPPRAYESIAKVREYGNKKYNSPWGWLETTTPDQYIEAAKRHILKIDLGETLDSESGLPHIEHALCSLAMAVELIKRGK